MTSHEGFSAAPQIRNDDEGLSLIELIMVVVLVGILSGVLVMILVNSWNAQRDVSSTTVATNEGQVFASSVERAVRNAEAIEVTGGNVLRVRTTLPGERQCQFFRLTVSSGTADAAFMAFGSSAPAWPGPWITEDVTAIGAAPYFALGGGAVTYAFQVTTDSSPVLFQGRVAARNDVTAGGGAPCW
ncbi:prepilin-type N-terminal cleavage/methylation domain-containing protein [Microbacterium sp. NPDC089318]